MDKQAIIARIKGKFTDVNLSKARLDELADRIEKKGFTDEKEIDTWLDDNGDFIKDIAAADDKIRDYRSKLKSKPETSNQSPASRDKDGKDTGNGDAQPKPEEPPAWAKPLFEKLERYEKQEKQGKIREMLKTHEKLKDIPEAFYRKWQLPDSVDAIDAFADDVRVEFDASGLTVAETHGSIIGPVPRNGTGGGASVTASKEEIKSIVKNIMP